MPPAVARAVDRRTTAANGAEKMFTVDDLCEYFVVSKDFGYDDMRHGRLLASRIARHGTG